MAQPHRAVTGEANQGLGRFGVHLALMDFGGQRLDVEHLVEYVETATALGFDAVAVNDHMVFGVPWLDGPTALASVVSCSGVAQLFTTVANPVVRGPLPWPRRWLGWTRFLAGGSSRGSALVRPSESTRALAMRLTSDGPASMSR
jgi:hypothetical protein